MQVGQVNHGLTQDKASHALGLARTSQAPKPHGQMMRRSDLSPAERAAIHGPARAIGAAAFQLIQAARRSGLEPPSDRRRGAVSSGRRTAMMSSVMPLGSTNTSVPPASMKHRPLITNSRSRLLTSLVGGRYTICSTSDRSSHPIVPECETCQPSPAMAGPARPWTSATAERALRMVSLPGDEGFGLGKLGLFPLTADVPNRRPRHSVTPPWARKSPARRRGAGRAKEHCCHSATCPGSGRKSPFAPRRERGSKRHGRSSALAAFCR
jgi:hypothetical protein